MLVERYRARSPRWSREETSKIESMISRGLTPAQIAAEFPGRSIHAVKARIRGTKILGRDVPRAPDWTRPELDKLERMLAQGLTPRKMVAALPGRGLQAVRTKITTLRIEAMKNGSFRFASDRNRWTHEKIERLHVLLGEGRPIAEVAGILGHSQQSCRNKANQLGISIRRIRQPKKCIATMQKPAAPRHQQPWTKEEEQRLLVLATHHLSCAEIGAKLNRTAISVEVRLKALSRGVVGAKKKEGRRRPCLRCTRPFDSEGPHNRLCKDCRQDTGTVFTTPVAVIR